TGANQTIDQVELYGSHARAYLEPRVPVGLGDSETWREAGARAIAASGGAEPGPVHVNCPFEEPLVPTSEGSLATPVSSGAPRDPQVGRGEGPEPAPEDGRWDGAMLGGGRGVVMIRSRTGPAVES